MKLEHRFFLLKFLQENGIIWKKMQNEKRGRRGKLF